LKIDEQHSLKRLKRNRASLLTMGFLMINFSGFLMIDWNYFFGTVILICGFLAWFRGCYLWTRIKMRSPWWIIYGGLGLLGLIALAMLEDDTEYYKQKEAKQNAKEES